MSKFQEYLEMIKDETYIVFLPIEKDNLVDIDSGLFGVYTDEEYDRIKPYDQVQNYTTSYSFSSMKIAKQYVELVKKINGDLNNWNEVSAFEKINKIKKGEK